jgi:two-component system cell cycle sensor histidine kinase/response regulator CckA
MGQNCKTVLLVDDEEIVLNLGIHMLQKLGFDVLSAKDAAEAFEIYRRHHDKIDLVIMDLAMPHGGGLGLYKQIQQLNSDLKVIATSGYDCCGQMDELSKLGCNSFLQKPFVLNQLADKIDEVLNQTGNDYYRRHWSGSKAEAPEVV